MSLGLHTQAARHNARNGGNKGNSVNLSEHNQIPTAPPTDTTKPLQTGAGLVEPQKDSPTQQQT